MNVTSPNMTTPANNTTSSTTQILTSIRKQKVYAAKKNVTIKILISNVKETKEMNHHTIRCINQNRFK